jgi:hypothetical protein
MSWENRKGRGRYYTRSRRVNGRVVREYVGCGDLAEAIAAADVFERKQRQSLAATSGADQQRRDAAEEQLVQLANATDLFVWAALELSGFYQHNRGQWRRSRHAAQ